MLGLADVDYNELGPDLHEILTEYYRVDDMHNYDSVLNACRYFEEKYGPIHRLDSHAEYWLETEARLRTDLGIEGIQNDVIEGIKQKSRMKAQFKQAGVPVAAGQICKTLDEATAFVKQHGFPIVAKPDIGVGAAATYKLKSPDELEAFFKNPPNVDYIFEAFISGDIYSFDGLADRNGDPYFYTSHCFSNGIMETVLDNDQLYYYSLREIPKDLEEAGRKVLKAFNVRERFFHFEFFRTHHDGRIVALEVNMRPPGGFTTDMFNYANDIDIYREWAKVVTHQPHNTQWERPYHVIYIARKSHLNYAISHDEILEQYADLLCHHQPIPEVFSTVLGQHGYIARSPELDPLLNMAKHVQTTS